MTLCHLVLQQKGSNQSQAAIFSHFWIASAVNPGDTVQSGFTALLIQNEFWIVFAVEPGVHQKDRFERFRVSIELLRYQNYKRTFVIQKR